MGRRGGSRSSFGVLQIVLGAAALLGVCIGLAFMFAPEKPPAPPSSKVTYRAESPKDKKADAGDLPLPDLPGLPKRPDAPEAPKEQTAEAQKAKPYQVTGIVTDARTKLPVADALVTLTRQWTPAEQRDWEARNAQARLGTDQALARALREEHDHLTLTERTRTKEDGHFEIGLDVTGQYQAEAVHRQYMLSKADAGAVSKDVPAVTVMIALSNGATISGKVTEIGAPTPAPQVKVVVEHDSVHTATTDAKGQYQIEGLSPGEYGVLVDTGGTAYKPGRTLPYQKVTIQQITQDLRNVDFQVEPAGVVWGYIKSPDNQPIKGAEVLLTSQQSLVSQAITAAIKQAPPVRGTSQDDGYYELLGVPINEEWRVYATAKSASPQLAEPFMLTGEVRSVQIDVFLYGGSDVHGVVVDTKNKPVEGAQVACIPSYTKMFSANDSPAAFRNTKSEADGSFTIEKLPAGDYQILAQKKDYKVPTNGLAIYPDGMSPLDKVTVQLLPVDEGTHYVSGTVTDSATREGISGVKVALSGFGSDTLNNFTREASTDGKGSFMIDGLEAGSYRLRLSKDGYSPKTQRVLLDAETAITMSQSAVLRGHVLVKETNKPPTIPYTVTAYPMSETGGVDLMAANDNNTDNPGALNNPDGSFELYVSPGNYIVKAKAPDYTPATQAVEAAAGQVVDDITLLISQAGGSISGHVSAKNGDSVNGAVVTLVEDGANTAIGGGPDAPQTMRVQDDGLFTFSNLAEGAYHAVAAHPSFANAKSRTVLLQSNQTVTDADIVLGSGGIIQGRVLHGGKPQVGATVAAVSLDNGSKGSATVDGSGNYTMDGLGAGQYSVTWIPAEGGIASIGNIAAQQTSVTEDAPTTLNFGVEGVPFTVLCTPAPTQVIGGIAILQEVGSGAPNAIQLGNIAGLQFRYTATISFGAGTANFDRVDEGEYQLVIYYADISGGGPGQGGGGGGAAHLVFLGPRISVTGGTPQMAVPVQPN